MKLVRNSVLTIAALSAGLFAASPARAASLQKVEQSVWQGGVTLPSYVNMYIYVPDKLATKPPILVASHHCQGTGTTTFNETKSTLVPLADKNGFIMIFPEATGHNCWDVGSAKSLKHDGGGDTHAVAQMVRYTISKYGANPGRVYAFGGSSGGMMTQGLLGVYPDIFMGGASISGVPCGCWSEGYSGDVASNGQWSGPCAGGTVTKTAEQWGEYVRSMFPGYTGHRPRVQIWHGDPDSTINFNNHKEAIKEWTNLLGLSATPTTTENPDANTTHQSWKNSCGYVVLDAYAIKGAGHAVQWSTNTVAGFLSLDKVADEDPETAACGGGTGGTGGGTGGATGAGGAGGVSGTGGATGAGGTGGARDGGRDVAGDGQAPGTGGGVGSGGSGAAGSGGATGSGGASAGSGGAGRGGATGSGGSVATGGSVASGGSAGSGGAGSGGTTGSGGSSASGGSAAGGSSASGGANGQGGSSTGGDPAAASGCSCALGNRAGNGAAMAAALLVALGLVFRRRRR